MAMIYPLAQPLGAYESMLKGRRIREKTAVIKMIPITVQRSSY
jgi:hypothetical protein